ncbi:hypothetical protein [Pontibacter kalidii]|uniref:hypothetical protein n=1 Tax=Pontibacter kalidii TaxID=2592049 RepID=UPI002250A6EC|nr:hypothetical protein [Pontibacter kalidii]
MKTYEFLGGGQIQAASNLDLVWEMRNTSHTESADLEEFMAQTARRCKLQNGSDIRTESVDIFVADLIEAGFVIEK